MIYADGQWTLSANGLKAWTAACDRGIRRWSGVGITLREMNALVVHVEGLLQEIQAFVPIPEDLPRHGTAIRVAEPILAEIRTNLPTWETDRVNAAAEVTRLKRLKAEPPTASP
jgi:hypothetical protein